MAKIPKVFGPEFELHLNDGHSFPRKFKIQRMHSDQVFLCQATDHPHLEPRVFFIKACLPIPRLFNLLNAHWNLGKRLPPFLSLKKRLPTEVGNQIQELPSSQIWTFLEEIAQRGYLLPITPLKRGAQPKGIRWEQVPSLCFQPAQDPTS